MGLIGASHVVPTSAPSGRSDSGIRLARLLSDLVPPTTIAALLAPPRAARLVTWGNAYLLGHVDLDSAAHAVTEGDVEHLAHNVPGENAPVSVPVLFGRLRAAGATGLRLVLPVPGDPVGLPGPAELTVAAVAVGQAVVVVGADLMLLPAMVTAPDGGAVVDWVVHPCNRVGELDGAPSLAEADRALALALIEATRVLQDLDVASQDPATLHRVAALREGLRNNPLSLAPGSPRRAHSLLGRAEKLAAILALALVDEGGALSSAQARARREALLPLNKAVRHARAAAFSAAAEPR